MNIAKNIFYLFLLTTNFAFAANVSSIEFFASNNSKEINLSTAYARLTGKEQHDLQNAIIDVMQKNHIEQGKTEDLLGAYRMASDQNITADNSEHFTSSPYQRLSNDKAFAIAQQLAIALNQESVAVLIPNQTLLGDITVSFTSHQPSINEITGLLHDKLPPLYNQAFSLHLAPACGGFESAKVLAIEWLGSKPKLADVQKAFPLETISYHYGKVYLVYKNGQHDQI